MSNPLFVHATFMPPQAAVLTEARAPEAQPSTSSAAAPSESESSNQSTMTTDLEKNMSDVPKPARRCKAQMPNFMRKGKQLGNFLWLLLLLLILIALGAVYIKHRLEVNAAVDEVKTALDEVRKAAAAVASTYGVDRREE